MHFIVIIETTTNVFELLFTQVYIIMEYNINILIWRIVKSRIEENS